MIVLGGVRELSDIVLMLDYTEMGIGVKQDMESAKRWYMRAAGESIQDLSYHPPPLCATVEGRR